MMYRVFLLLLLFIILHLGVLGQVNIEVMRPKAVENRFEQHIGLDVNWVVKQDRLDRYRMSYRFEWQKLPYLIFFSTRFDHEKKDTLLIRDNGFSHLRGILNPLDTLQYEAFAQKEYDVFLNLTDRVLLGAGWRMKCSPIFAGQDPFFWGIGMLHEKVSLSEADSSINRVRLSTYLTFFHTFDHMAFNFTAYLQPAITDFGDLKGLINAGATIPFSSQMSYRASIVTKYHRTPYPGLDPINITIDNALYIQF